MQTDSEREGEWEREGRRGRERDVVVVGKEGRESERDWCVADRESLRRFVCVRKCRRFVCVCLCVCLSMCVCLCP
jgi:hypothetical protein